MSKEGKGEIFQCSGSVFSLFFLLFPFSCFSLRLFFTCNLFFSFRVRKMSFPVSFSSRPPPNPLINVFTLYNLSFSIRSQKHFFEM